MKRSPNIQLLGGAGVALAALYLGTGNAPKCRYEYYTSYADCVAKNNPSNCTPAANNQQWAAYKCPSRSYYSGGHGSGYGGSGWYSKRGGFGSSGRGFFFGG